MRTRNEIILLHVIENHGNVRRLLREGLTYKEISELLSNLANEHFLEYVDKRIVLTNKGKKALAAGWEFIKEVDKNLWIEPEHKSKVKKFDKNFIFLPNQSELDF